MNFAKELGWPNHNETRDAAQIIQIIPFSSEWKVKLVHGYHLYVKGASEILTKLCKWHVAVHQQGGPADCGDVELTEIDDFSEENITRTITPHANQTLRTIGAPWPPPDMEASVVNEVCVFGVEDIVQGLTLIGIVDIEDPLRDRVRKAAKDCHKAGVAVKMYTGDNVLSRHAMQYFHGWRGHHGGTRFPSTQ